MDPNGARRAVKKRFCQSGGGSTTNRRGFTLIELLIAAALGVLVVAAVVTALAGGIRVWERATQGTSSFDAAVAIEWLQRDLHNSTATRSGAFEGTADGMHFPVLVAATGAPGAFNLQGVSYAAPAGRSTLERSAGDWPGGKDVADGEILVAGLESVRFSYRAGAQGDWLAAWTSRTNRPASVEVVLRFSQDRGGLEITRTILVPGF